MRKLIILAALALSLGACAATPYGTYQTPGDRLAAGKADLENRMINLYGYQAYAECRGRGLSLLSNALMYCLDSKGPSKEAINRAMAAAAAEKAAREQAASSLLAK